MTALRIISKVMNFIYSFAWTAGLCCLAYGVNKSKDGDGLSINFLLLSFISFTFGSTYNIYGYMYDPTYSSGQITVVDIVYTITAQFLISVNIILVLYYPRVQNYTKCIWLTCCILTVISIGMFAAYNPKVEQIVKFMGLIRVMLSFIHYVPQVYLNWSRKSTYGWSISFVILDLIGGCLSFLQIFIDYASTGTFSQFSTNLNFSKFLVGLVTISFDLIFMFQHYVLYYDNRDRPPTIEYNNMSIEDRKRLLLKSKEPLIKNPAFE